MEGIGGQVLNWMSMAGVIDRMCTGVMGSFHWSCVWPPTMG
jgi:hypothetical protein